MGTTHPLPHKVVGQISGQHVRTERRFHHTLVDLENKKILTTGSVFSVLEIQKEDFKHFSKGYKWIHAMLGRQNKN